MDVSTPLVLASKLDDISSSLEDSCPLLDLPINILTRILNKLDARTLVNVELTSRVFRVRHPSSGMRLTEHAAREAYEARHGTKPDHNKQHPTWKASLHSDCEDAGFDTELGEREGFVFIRSEDSTRLSRVKLVGLGPKMLVSDLSTSQQPLMRWRLRVKGNTVVEFGIVPVELQERKKALHKCLTETNQLLCVGFCSQRTDSSQLPFRCPVVKGSIVEISIENGEADFLVMNPADGWDVLWQNNRRHYTQYRGPREIRFTQDFPPELDVKLASTAWAKADFEVLHFTHYESSTHSELE